MIRLWRDRAGAVLVEYTIVFPVFILVTLGTVDLSYMFVEWSMANKAAYVGARTAIVSDPVAANITDPNFLFTSTQLGNDLGQPCLDPTTGDANSDVNGNYCPSTNLSVTCTSTGCNLCNGCTAPNNVAVTFSSSAFTNANDTGIFDRMKQVYPALQPDNVTITYQINGTGFVGIPGGLPMNVTVSIVGMSHQLFFAPGILGFFGVTTPGSWSMPTFASTLTSEDMVTN